VTFERLEDDLTIAELTTPAGLLLVPALSARLLANGLEIRNARLVQVDLDVEAVLQPVYRDLDVNL
jgi:hypothetical protein